MKKPACASKGDLLELATLQYLEKLPCSPSRTAGLAMTPSTRNLVYHHQLGLTSSLSHLGCMIDGLAYDNEIHYESTFVAPLSHYSISKTKKRKSRGHYITFKIWISGCTFKVMYNFDP